MCLIIVTVSALKMNIVAPKNNVVKSDFYFASQGLGSPRQFFVLANGENVPRDFLSDLQTFAFRNMFKALWFKVRGSAYQLSSTRGTDLLHDEEKLVSLRVSGVELQTWQSREKLQLSGPASLAKAGPWYSPLMAIR